MMGMGILLVILTTVCLISLFGGWLWLSERRWKRGFVKKCEMALERNREWDRLFFQRFGNARARS